MSTAPRVGLAGYGGAGRGIHAPLLAAAGMPVAAVATANPERVAQARAELPGARVVDDLDALLAQDLDLVVLATHSGVHAAQALRVIGAGIPLVVDKPLGVDAGEALRVVQAAREADVPLVVFQNRRFDAEHATLRELVRGGRLGEVYRAELRWERWRPVPKQRWREEAAPGQGGGILLDLHTHLVDAAVDLFGPVEAVYAEVGCRTTPAEDDAFLACRHASGVVSHLGAMSVAAAPGPRMRVLGSRAAYLLGQFEQELNIFADLANADERHCGWIYEGPEREPARCAQSSEVDFYRAVAAALTSEDPQAAMPVDPWDAVHVMAVIDAARVSAERRTVETVGAIEPPGAGTRHQARS